MSLPRVLVCARRFHSCAAFRVKETMLGPLVMKLICLMLDMWRYGMSDGDHFPLRAHI